MSLIKLAKKVVLDVSHIKEDGKIFKNIKKMITELQTDDAKVLKKQASQEPIKPLNPAHKGLLHEYLGVPQGESISIDKIKSKLNSETDPIWRKRLNFALVAKTKWHKKG